MPSQANLTAELLRKLHRIHRQLSDLNERLQRGPKQIRAREANVLHCEEQLGKARQEVKDLRLRTDQKQLQLRSNEQKIKELQVQLNQAASNREYQILKDRIAADRQSNSVLEDEILEGFERVEQLQGLVAAAEAAVEKANAEAERVSQDVLQKQPGIENDISRLEAELAECESSLPDDIRDVYQRQVRQRGSDALAPIDGEYCGGCHQHVPLNMLSKLMLGSPIFCKTCGRLLYLAEEA
jgi:predicted  nucleic acid-binding Zn-ribbon protein